MHVTIFEEESGNSFKIEISTELLLGHLKLVIQTETGIPTHLQILTHGGTLLVDDNLALPQLRVASDDLIILTKKSSEQETGEVIEPSNGSFGDQNSTHLGDQCHASSSNSNQVTNHEEMKIPFSLENKEKTTARNKLELLSDLQEYIRQTQIDDNLQLAYDISPESFVAVNLLYIKIKINGHEAFALVDTGAQQTVLHPSLAKRFGILNLVDKRFASTSIGIGTQQSRGKIHSVPVSLGDLNIDIPCSFTILDIHVGVLFGLDMLKRHKCTVDLGVGSLVIGHNEVKFASDYEIERTILPWQAENKLTRFTDGYEVSTLTRKGDSEENPEHDSYKSESSQKSFSEESISRIVALGFSRREAIDALHAAGGNVDIAASSLF